MRIWPLILLLTGCASTLKPGAEKVTVSEIHAPANCVLLKEVTPLTSLLISIGSTDEQKVGFHEMTFKNWALDHGGNYVEITRFSANEYEGKLSRCP